MTRKITHNINVSAKGGTEKTKKFFFLLYTNTSMYYNKYKKSIPIGISICTLRILYSATGIGLDDDDVLVA